ncbi:MAG: hypothetical protein SO088_02085, partial [Ruminococcus callidus]|nr:hypothetical protein [Ruminococcus callidus]
ELVTDPHPDAAGYKIIIHTVQSIAHVMQNVNESGLFQGIFVMAAQNTANKNSTIALSQGQF